MLEQAVCELRAQHPAWGARKLAKRLTTLGVQATSTVHAILRRHGLVSAQASEDAQHWQRFEHPQPNDLWQMDFKGHVPMRQGRCHPLTVVDDHSRYAILLRACADETENTVKSALITAFERYGVPARMSMDNGSPWGHDGQSYTRLEVWLMKQGIRVSHSRPYYLQTQGKNERFHRSLKVEALQGVALADLAYAQAHFDTWRHVYNQQRPHEALGMEVPLSRYRPSPGVYTAQPAAPEYDQGDIVRRVQHGRMQWRTRQWRVGKAFHGESVAIRPTMQEGIFHVVWYTTIIARIDLTCGTSQSGRCLH